MDIQIIGLRDAGLVAFRKLISDLAADLGARSFCVVEVNGPRAVERMVGPEKHGLAINGQLVWKGDKWPEAEMVTHYLVDALRRLEEERLDEPEPAD